MQSNNMLFSFKDMVAGYVLMTAVTTVTWVVSNLWRIVAYVRVYDMVNDAVAEKINDIANGPGMIRLGGNLLFRRMRVPFVAVGTSVVILSRKIEHDYRASTVEITVVRFYWHGPIVPDPRPSTSTHHTIRCMMDVSTNPKECNIGTFNECAVASAIPSAIVERSSAVAQEMVDIFLSRQQNACAFIVSGPPGTGKSLSARIVAHKLNGTLYTGLDTSRHSGISVWSVVQDYADVDRPLVLVFEEFDVALERIVLGLAQDSESCRADTTSKSTWNEFLSGLSRKTNVVLILTTNRTDEELDLVCNHDASLLRPGRITKRFVVASEASEASSDIPSSAENSVIITRDGRADGRRRSRPGHASRGYAKGRIGGGF